MWMQRQSSRMNGPSMPKLRVSVGLLYAAVFVLAMALYARTWSYGYTYLDDTDIILTHARVLAEPSSLLASFTRRYFLNDFNHYYRPLVNLSFAIDAQLGGTIPSVYHVTNGLFHAIACTLLFSLMRGLEFGNGPSAAAALLFSVYPMHVASVAWIPGRNDALLGCFALGSLVLLVKAITHPGPLPRVGHFVCFVGALLSKETAVCLPLIFLALLVAVEGWPNAKKRRWFAVGWGLVIVGYFGARAAVVVQPAGYATKLIHGAWGQRWVLLSDFGKSLLPFHLQVLSTPKDVHVWPGVVALGFVAASLWLIPRMRRDIVLLGCTMMTLPLLLAMLASDFVILESRLYLPIAGASLLIAELLRAIRMHRPRLWCLTLTVAGSLCLVFSLVTLRYSKLFSDREQFSQAAIKASPGSYLAMWLDFTRSKHGPNGPVRSARP